MINGIPNGGGSRRRLALDDFDFRRAENRSVVLYREMVAAEKLVPVVEGISDQGRSWLKDPVLDLAQVVPVARERPAEIPVIGPIIRAAEAVGDVVMSAGEIISGLFESGSDEMDLDGDGDTGGEEETIESLAAMFGLSADQLAFMVLGTTALVPFVPKALALTAGTALVVPGAKALMIPMIRAIAARTVALAPYTLLKVAGGKSMLAMILKILMGLLTAKEIYDILSDLFPSIFPPLWDRRGPAVAVYERGSLVAFARGPVVSAPGGRRPRGRYVRMLHATGPRVEIVT